MTDRPVVVTRASTRTFVIHLRAAVGGDLRGEVEDVGTGARTVVTSLADIERVLRQWTSRPEQPLGADGTERNRSRSAAPHVPEPLRKVVT